MDSEIVTLTFSPALDVATSVESVAPSKKLRCRPPRTEPGGGGVNVARVARRLGVGAVAVAPLSGPGAQRAIEDLAAEGVTVRAIETDQPIRQSFSVTEDSTGHQFRFVLPPQPLDATTTDACITATCELGAHAGCVVVSGSMDLPDVAEALRRVVVSVSPTVVIVDTSGEALDAALDSGAALVKPSARELSGVVGRPLDTEVDVMNAAVRIADERRIGGVLVSIGSGGAVLARAGEAPVRFRAPTVRVRSTIGAGDSLVAGIATALCRGADLTDAIRLGIAAGSATVLTAGTELCDPDVVAQLLPMVAVHS